MFKKVNGPQRQREIYTDGAGGKKPSLPMTPQGLEQTAAAVMSREAFDYVAGGAGAESTMAANLRGFRDVSILPRMLQDVSQRETSLTLLGRQTPLPIFTCPVGVLDLAHPQGDVAVAKACSEFGIPMTFSNQASFSMEDCSQHMGDSPRWFQLYWSQSNDLVESFLSRAENCGCSALVVTLDTTLLGWRARDLENAFLPFLFGRGIAQYITDPVFQALLDQPDSDEEPAPPLNAARLRLFLKLCARYPGDFWQNFRSKRPLAAVRKFTKIYSRPSLGWGDLAFLRSKTKLPIVLKGILDPEDARKALDHGVDGIYVSNHGGRQVDGSIGAIQALPEIADAVAGNLPILFDSGIRTGADIFKALALGATAVGIGRPYVWGLALRGEAGVKEVLSNLWAEFDLTMGLAGCSQLSDINETRIR